MAKSQKKTRRARRGPGLHKRPDRVESEQKLIEAGIEVFSQYGYDGASVQKIAERSGVNVSLINRYFGNKEGLLNAIAKLYADGIQTRRFDYPPKDTIFEELFEYAKADLEDSLKHKDMLRVLIGRCAVDETFRRETLKNIPLDQIDPFLDERLHRLKKMGKIDPKVDLNEVQHVLGFQFFSTIFLSNMILAFDEKRTLELLTHFVETYSRGLEYNP